MVVIICCSHAVPNMMCVRDTLKIMIKTTKDANSHILVPTGQLAPSNDVYIYMQMFQKKRILTETSYQYYWEMRVFHLSVENACH